MIRQASARVAVLVPCYNEERTVGRVVADFERVLPGCTVYVCDNASTDRTARFARRAGAVVEHEPRKGKGHAVRRLFADVDADVYLLVDGDLTYDAESAPRLVRILQEERLDMVVGARRTEPAEDGEAYRYGHRLGNRAFTSCVSTLFGRGVEDLFSGYRCLSKRFVKSFPTRCTGFDIETELVVHALGLNLPFQEVPTPYHSRPKGSESKLHTYTDGARIALRIFLLFESHRPALFFGVTSALLLVLSLALGTPLVLEYLETGLVPRFPSAILATGLAMIGSLAAVCGIVLASLSQARAEAKWLAYLRYPPPPLPAQDPPTAARRRRSSRASTVQSAAVQGERVP